MGGAETLVMNVFRHIDRTRVLFDAAVQNTAPAFYEEEFQRLGGRIFRLPYPNRRTLLEYVTALRRILREQGPFVAVHNHLSHSGALAISVARSAGVPVRIVHGHNSTDGKPTTVARS
jgi:glycosyltransferase EpsF